MTVELQMCTPLQRQLVHSTTVPPIIRLQSSTLTNHCKVSVLHRSLEARPDGYPASSSVSMVTRCEDDMMVRKPTAQKY